MKKRKTKITAKQLDKLFDASKDIMPYLDKKTPASWSRRAD